MSSLTRQVCMIGSSTIGIGLGMLRSLAQGGATVVMHGLEEETILQAKIDDLTKEFGVQTGFSTANVRKPQEIR